MIGPAAANAVPELLAILIDARERPAGASGTFGRIKDAILRFRDSTDLPAVAQALAKIGSAAMPGLVAALGDSRRTVRTSAASALARAGVAAVPALIVALQDPKSVVRNRAANILVQIGRPAATDALSELTKRGDKDAKRIAAWTLAQIRQIPDF
jgi:HEAT repeat protein